MSSNNRWFLPEGIEQVLPPRAWQIELLRRQLLDLYHSWGYELVIPPFIEYLESLLTGVGSDLDLQTFKVTDQLSGRTMGLRADITPQVARIEASLKRNSVVRLSYSGSVLMTRPHNQLSSRSPLQIGAELYGSAEASADMEIINLMLTTLKVAGLTDIYLDLGHVGIYRSLVESIELGGEQKTILFEILQRKSAAELDDFISSQVPDPQLASHLQTLLQLHGGQEVLARARKELDQVPGISACLNNLDQLATSVRQSHADVQLYFDLSELRGYQYHTGVVFAAYVEGLGQSVAKGGRYDDIGSVFGRSRPATGFSADLKTLTRLLPELEVERPAVLAPLVDDPDLEAEITRLREAGEVVIRNLERDQDESSAQLRKLVKRADHWTIE